MGNITRKRRNKRSQIKEQQNEINEIQLLQSEISTINKLLDQLPETSVVEKMGLEYKKSEVIKQIEEPKEKVINPITEAINKSVAFSKAGRPRKFLTPEEVEQKENERKAKSKESLQKFLESKKKSDI